MSVRTVTLLALAGLAAVAWTQGRYTHADGWPTTPPLPENHPVPGWVYELTYEMDSGQVISVVGYDAAGPPLYGVRDGRTATLAKPGQAIMDVSKHPELTEIMANVDAYQVDGDGRDVKRRPEYAGPSGATPGASNAYPPEYLPPLLLGIAVGAAFLTRIRWKR